MDKIQKLGIIPARYGSTRFPGKPLAMIGGKTMIERVYNQAKKANLDKVVVATDDERIADAVRAFGGNYVMTDSDLPSGTDRCRAAMNEVGQAEMVINIQGDEPFIDPEQINQIIALLEKGHVDIATLISPAESDDEIQNPNRVKAVVSKQGKALYFSRLPIPFIRDSSMKTEMPLFIHLGIYGFKGVVLNQLATLEQSHLERCESLEQLRWLENDYNIYTGITESRADAVDTPEDLIFIEKKFFL